MQLAQSFEVAAPIDRVWRALIDIEHVAPCLPGAAVTGRNEDGSYQGSFSVKIGPTSASYTGKLEMLEVDEAEHRAMMHANGTDKRGQGGATATIVSKLAESAAGGTHVEVQTDYKITGRLARFGRGGMIEDISERLLRQFAERLAASLVEGDGAGTDSAAQDLPAEAAGAADAQAAGGAAEADGQGAGSPTSNGASAAGHARVHETINPPPEPAELPDMGRLATAALLSRITRSPAAALVVGLVVGYAIGALRSRGRRS